MAAARSAKEAGQLKRSFDSVLDEVPSLPRWWNTSGIALKVTSNEVAQLGASREFIEVLWKLFITQLHTGFAC